MATVDNQGVVTMQELIASSLAQTDALTKLLIEKGIITEAEYMKKLSAERSGDQAVFQKIRMAEHREITPAQLKEFVEARRKWMETGRGEVEKEYLVNANLQGAYLREANLRGINLRGANLQGAYMIKADLQEANLVEANLQEATPLGANFQGADLRDANLQGTKLLTTRGLTARQVKTAKNWVLAFYSDDFLKELGLPPDHNEWVEKELAELEKKKKEAATKK